MSNEPRFEVFPEREQVDIHAFDEAPGSRTVDGATTGEYGWRFRAANGKISAIGGEGFTRREDARRAIQHAVSDILSVVYFEPTEHPASDIPSVIRLDALPIVDLDENGDEIVAPRGEEVCQPVDRADTERP